MKSKIEYLRNSKVIWYGIATAIIAFLIYLADISEFLEALRSVETVPMALAIFSGLSVFLIWGFIWHSFFTNLEIKSSLYKSYKMFMAGHFMNSITPLGQLGGEPFMAFIVSKNTDTGYERSLSAVMSSDIVIAIPVIIYTILGIIYLLLSNTFSRFMEQAVYFGLGAALITSLLIYLLWFDRDKMEKGLFRILDFLEKKFEIEENYFKLLKEKIKTFKTSLEEIGEDPRHLLEITAISHLYPITQFICLYFILTGLNVNPGIVGIYFTVILASIAIFSPTPGGAGTYEAVFTALLSYFYPAMTLDTAVATAVLFRLTTFWPGIVIGYFSLITLRRERNEKRPSTRENK